jgi:hypothetical protein
MLGRFVGDPELGILHRHPRHHRSIGSIYAKQLPSAERSFVKFHGLCTIPDR